MGLLDKIQKLFGADRETVIQKNKETLNTIGISSDAYVTDFYSNNSEYNGRLGDSTTSYQVDMNALIITKDSLVITGNNYKNPVAYPLNQVKVLSSKKKMLGALSVELQLPDGTTKKYDLQHSKGWPEPEQLLTYLSSVQQ